MANRMTLMLTNGGTRSLVAAAIAASESPRRPMTWLHLTEGRPRPAGRQDRIQKQAKHFGVDRVIELALAQPRPHQTDITDPTTGSPLVRWRRVMLGLATAVHLEADRLVWPIQANGEFDTVSRVTEQLVLLQHLTRLESSQSPPIETPLLELTDQQLIELGAQLQAPWALAWSCRLGGEKPCRVCDGCRRRRIAFDHAGISDPIDEVPVASR